MPDDNVNSVVVAGVLNVKLEGRFIKSIHKDWTKVRIFENGRLGNEPPIILLI